MPQNEEGGGWRRGTTWDKRTEWGWKTNRAKPVKLRQFNSRTGEDKWFPAGRDYYAHNRQKFIINVPCLGYIPYSKTNEGLKAALIGLLLGGGNQMPPPSDDPDADDTANEPLLRSTFYGNGHSERVIPLTPEALGNYDRPATITRLLDLGLVRDQDHSQADIEAALRREIPALLAQAPRVNTVDGLKHKIAIESTII